MTDATKKSEAAPKADPRVTTEIATGIATSIDYNDANPEAVSKEDRTDEWEAGQDTLEGGGDADENAEGSEPDPNADPDADAEDEGGKEAAETTNDLPDFDPENEEVVQQYEAKYFKDGELNREVVSAEFWKSFEANGGDVSKSGLAESTYKYLETALGVPKAMAKDIEAGLVAKHQQEQDAYIRDRVPGGVEAYNRAVKWAQGGGYSEAQRQRFRDAFSKGGEDQADAVDALMARFGKNANKDREERRGDRRGPPRRSSPSRDATGGAGVGAQAGAGDRFKNSGEHQAAWNSAIAELNAARQAGDRKAIAEKEATVQAVRKKARRGYSRR